MPPTVGEMLVSQPCRYESLRSPELRAWSERLRPAWDPDGVDPRDVMVHRKMWEWLFICQALAERGMLEAGRRGLGFGVGREPLVALFAACGCDLVATDLSPERAEAAGWADAGGAAAASQYAGSRAGLNDHGLCDQALFEARVRFRHVDMNELPDDLRGFDFTWSSCALEHLGSLAAGADFVVAQMRCLRPGGVAVHTTELNVSSDTDTYHEGGTVLYRRRDVEELAARLRKLGHRIELDLTPGTTPADLHVDVAPFTDTHLRTRLGDYVTTSLALVIERGPAG